MKGREFREQSQFGLQHEILFSSPLQRELQGALLQAQ